MKINICLFLIFTILSCNKQMDNTTLYFVRHSEKDLTTKTNPELTEAGIKRASQLAAYLSDKSIDKVYSTNFKRTVSTALPTAKNSNKEIIIYDQKNINIHTLASQNKGKSILVVGHSNTIPFLVNDLINEDVYAEIDERIYSDLFIVEIKNNKITHNKIKLN